MGEIYRSADAGFFFNEEHMEKQREFVDDAPIDESDKIIVRGEQPLARTSTRDPLALIELALEKGLTLSDMQGLAALAEKAEKTRAMREFNAAMIAFRAACPVIFKTHKTGIGQATYAPLDEIEAKVAPHLEANGLHYTYPSCLMTENKNIMRGVCRVTHFGGHSEETSVELPVPTEMRGPNMIQQAGITMSYLRRYSLCLALGLRIAKEDTDGIGIGPDVVGRAITPVTIEQANAIQSLLSQIPPLRRTAFFGWASDQAKRDLREVIDLPQSLVQMSIDLLKKEIARTNSKGTV